jgi:hypothetical protein
LPPRRLLREEEPDDRLDEELLDERTLPDEDERLDDPTLPELREEDERLGARTLREEEEDRLGARTLCEEGRLCVRTLPELRDEDWLGAR